MSSSPPISPNVAVDLESVLNVGRRRLASIGEGATSPFIHHRYSDTIYVKREEKSHSILSIESKTILLGELQYLCSLFERFTSHINVFEEASSNQWYRSNFSTTFEENENLDDDPLVSTLQQTSISSSPPNVVSPLSTSPSSRRKKLGSIGRSQTVSSTMTAGDYSIQNLEGKRYGYIELPSMALIEILEILLRTGLELVNVSSDYDSNQILHQNFVFSKLQPLPLKPNLQGHFSRSSSFLGT